MSKDDTNLPEDKGVTRNKKKKEKMSAGETIKTVIVLIFCVLLAIGVIYFISIFAEWYVNKDNEKTASTNIESMEINSILS